MIRAQRRLHIVEIEAFETALTPPIHAHVRVDQRRACIGEDFIARHAGGIILLAGDEGAWTVESQCVCAKSAIACSTFPIR